MSTSHRLLRMVFCLHLSSQVNMCVPDRQKKFQFELKLWAGLQWCISLIMDQPIQKKTNLLFIFFFCLGWNISSIVSARLNFAECLRPTNGRRTPKYPSNICFWVCILWTDRRERWTCEMPFSNNIQAGPPVSFGWIDTAINGKKTPPLSYTTTH